MQMCMQGKGYKPRRPCVDCVYCFWSRAKLLPIRFFAASIFWRAPKAQETNKMDNGAVNFVGILTKRKLRPTFFCSWKHCSHLQNTLVEEQQRISLLSSPQQWQFASSLYRGQTRHFGQGAREQLALRGRLKVKQNEKWQSVKQMVVDRRKCLYF